MAKGLLGSRFNEPPKRRKMGVYSSTRMGEGQTTPRPERIERVIGSFCVRPSRGKARNGFSREEAGTIGNIIVTKRFNNSRLTCVCKTHNYN